MPSVSRVVALGQLLRRGFFRSRKVLDATDRTQGGLRALRATHGFLVLGDSVLGLRFPEKELRGITGSSLSIGSTMKVVERWAPGTARRPEARGGRFAAFASSKSDYGVNNNG